MADQRLTDKSELSTLATGDKVHIVDVSDATDNAAGSSKWFLISTLSSYLAALTQTLTNKTLTSPKINEDVALTATSTELNSITGDLSTHIADTTTHGTTGAIVGASDTQTLTNKRITPRITTETSSATPTINTDNTDIHTITALAADITSMTTNLSGTPTNGQKLTVRILDDGTARAITWGASFASLGATLPTTTVISTTLYVDFVWNSTSSKWECVKTSSTSSSGGSITDEDNAGTSSTSSSTFADITGGDVSVTITATSNIVLNANVTAYGNVALAPYTIRWHDGTSVIGTTSRIYLSASNQRACVSVQTIVTNKTAGTHTFTIQHKSEDNSSSLTAETINLTAVAIPV